MKELQKKKNKSASENGALGFLLIAIFVLGIAVLAIWSVLDPITK